MFFIFWAVNVQAKYVTLQNVSWLRNIFDLRAWLLFSDGCSCHFSQVVVVYGTGYGEKT